MRHVVHLAVDPDRSDLGIGGECGDDAARVFEIGLRRRKASIDGCDLIGMDRDPADKSVPACDPATFRKSVLILEIRIQGFKRRGAGRTGGE